MPVKGISRCTVTHGQSFVPVEEGTCETVLSGSVAKQLGILHLTPVKNVFQLINIIPSQNKDQLQQILSKYPCNFEGLGNLKTH